MQLPDGTILMHGNQPYDPVKAHEYYLRYRQLHPRQGGSPLSKGTYVVGKGSSSVKLSATQLLEQKAYAAERTTQIKKRLSDLNAKLREKLKAAAEREQKAKQGPTAAEKSKAARDAKIYREKHKTEIANKAKAAAKAKAQATSSATPAKKSETVDSLKREIVTAKSDLKEAVAKQRELATATKNG